MRCSKYRFYSINSSAATSSDVGIVRPRALAVLRLMVNFNTFGCSLFFLEGNAP
jgi:hypothetical protein